MFSWCPDVQNEQKGENGFTGTYLTDRTEVYNRLSNIGPLMKQYSGINFVSMFKFDLYYRKRSICIWDVDITVTNVLHKFDLQMVLTDPF